MATVIQSQRRFLIWRIKNLLLVYFCYLVLDENLKHQMDMYKYSVLYFPYIAPQLFEICYNTEIVFYMLSFTSLLYALFLVYGLGFTIFESKQMLHNKMLISSYKFSGDQFLHLCKSERMSIPVRWPWYTLTSDFEIEFHIFAHPVSNTLCVKQKNDRAKRQKHLHKNFTQRSAMILTFDIETPLTYRQYRQSYGEAWARLGKGERNYGPKLDLTSDLESSFMITAHYDWKEKILCTSDIGWTEWTL